MKKLGCLVSSLIAVVVLAIGIFGYTISVNNKLIQKDEDVSTAWAEIQNQYQRRMDLIPNLVSTVKGYAAHESDVLSSVTEARSKVAGQINVSDEVLNDPDAFAKYQQAQDQLGSALSRLLSVTESYPDLKANENFLSLQDELAGTENRIAVARKRYNEVVSDYNVSIRKFPASIIAKNKGYEIKQKFQASAEAQTAPVVSF